MSKDQRIATIKSEIVNRVIAIETAKSDKKAHNQAMNGKIKTLEDERKQLLQELDELQRAELTEEADEILDESAN